MNIIKIVNEVAGENTYILENETHLLIVDPGSDWAKISSKLQELGKPLAAILLTHTHYDHIMSVDLVRDHFNQPPVYVAKEEADWLFTPELNLSALPRHDDMQNVILRPAEKIFELHKPYQMEGFAFEVRPTPGHSIGGVSFVFDQEALVITGDALFKGSIGRTDLYTGDLNLLKAGIQTELFTLPNDYVVHPGHGQSTTIGYEKAFNPWL
ncbi:MBL fold metallo-hydrolase [Streptococcus ovuberis]|uniref:MBL fold metallo-hydrolase n=1 Tax=Streptococcus ovuberis TaxID=1936207 RepID=A0A7X6MYV2_9STRE|nr:MBL fold metallo-hydrolase [Streptococcus ovuberis]NKZ20288.1 MBL fold metallo-hydrolase [Streptococcus ovuberis]